MRLLKNVTWEEVFNSWREREANDEGWIYCATKIKGWPDWESWRRHSASQVKADERDWQLHEFTDPLNEIPDMLIGPFSGWQSRFPEQNTATFADLLDMPENLAEFSQHEGILSIMEGLPFETDFIGLLREDTNQVVCLEGHHRAVAIALARKQGKEVDFSGVTVTIALARLPASEIGLLDEMVARGSSKQVD